MDLLEHPLEAFAFRLYSLPEASAATGAAAWTCLAAVLAAAAAAGLWRLRSSAPSTATVSTKPLELEPTPAADLLLEHFSSSERSLEPAAQSTAPSPKERYTAYYPDTGCVEFCDVGDEDDEEEDEAEAEEDDAEDHEDDDGSGAYRRAPVPEATDPFEWDVVRTLPLSPIAADVGRHRKSPTALSGSVVQLWDHQVAGGGGLTLTPTPTPRRRGRVVGTVAAF